ncbi:MAG TPA: flagellar basal body P-ring protein FlgI [Candidatus Gastranaerophilales bacterium]|nr:flagellar basal body P-ring protein FlgI [Candidatus Gastranaerophilales bacterium]
MKKTILILTLLIFFSSGYMPVLANKVRIKDITHIDGIRENQLVGYGIVVGLPGTGDNSRSTQITNVSLLKNLGTVIDTPNDIKKGNTAAVIITAMAPAFARNGDRIDITVSSLADCSSLEGGVLVQTHLLAPNGEVVAVAQGPISVGGTSVSAEGSSARTSIVTSGRIPNGAIIERDITSDIGDELGLKLVLHKSDFTMASRVADVISQSIAPAKAIDGSAISVAIPAKYNEDRIKFLSILENITLNPSDSVAKIVINERTGTIVIGNNVKLMPAAVAHGNLSVTVKTENEVSQPNEMATVGTTTAVSNSEIEITEAEGKFVEVPANANLSELVRALNSIGVTPFDLISILQALKAAGSLQATLEII